MSRAQAGSDQAFEELVVLHYERIYRFLLARSGDSGLIDDLAQETFVTALERIRQLRHPEAFSVWLFRIAHNLWRRYVRREHRARFIPCSSLSRRQRRSHPFVDPDPDVHRVPERVLVSDVLDELSPQQQEVLSLRYVDGFTDSEIASILGVSESAAQKRAYRTAIAFRQRYEEVRSSASTGVAEDSQ